MSEEAGDKRQNPIALRVDLAHKCLIYEGQNIFLTVRLLKVIKCIHQASPFCADRGTILKAVWGNRPRSANDSNVDKAIDELNEKLLPYRLEIKNEPRLGYRLIRSRGEQNVERPMDARADTAAVPHQNANGLPRALEARIDALRLAPPIADAVRRVLGAEKFPTIMTLSEDIVPNPIWEKIPLDDRQRLTTEYSPFGPMLRRFMNIDVCFLRADDANGNPYLLHYFSGKPKSGWQAYLFPFREKSPGETEQLRQAANAKIIAGYFLMSPSDFSTQSLGDQFVVSVKPDVGYSSELVTYIFNFCVVTMRIAPKWLSCLEPQLKNGQSVQKFRWFHAGELELEDRSVLVNADVLRGIHHFFGTSIPSVPVGFPGILETEC